MENKKPTNIFIQGAISPAFIAECIQKHSAKTNIGRTVFIWGK
jgi:molybdopterin synthase catalytic subunit